MSGIFASRGILLAVCASGYSLLVLFLLLAFSFFQITSETLVAKNQKKVRHLSKLPKHTWPE
jgi:uncharacterized membrane protein YqhA